MTDSMKQKAREWLDTVCPLAIDNSIMGKKHWYPIEKLCADFAAKCVDEEREACAKIAEDMEGGYNKLPNLIARRIRARGKEE